MKKLSVSLPTGQTAMTFFFSEVCIAFLFTVGVHCSLLLVNLVSVWWVIVCVGGGGGNTKTNTRTAEPSTHMFISSEKIICN